MSFPIHSVVTKSVESADGFGSAWIDPSEDVVAGSYGTWRLTYEAGTHAIGVGRNRSPSNSRNASNLRLKW
jgi:hypothetical protein